MANIQTEDSNLFTKWMIDSYGNYRKQHKRKIDTDIKKFQLPKKPFVFKGEKESKLLNNKKLNNEILDIFVESYSDPNIIKTSAKILLDTSEFITTLDPLIENATNILNDSKVNPYLRMTCQFYINSIRTLKNELVNKINVELSNDNNGAVNVDLSLTEKIRFVSEMEIIKLMVNKLEQYINSSINK